MRRFAQHRVSLRLATVSTVISVALVSAFTPPEDSIVFGVLAWGMFGGCMVAVVSAIWLAHLRFRIWSADRRRGPG